MNILLLLFLLFSHDWFAARQNRSAELFLLLALPKLLFGKQTEEKR